MVCHTADGWMVLDQEYYAKTEDYALVGESAKLIRWEIDEANNSIVPLLSTSLSYGDVLHLHRSFPVYDFASQGNRLIYADVDDSNPEHEKQVKELRSTEQELDRAYEKAIEAEGVLATHLGEAWKDRIAPRSIEETTWDQEHFLLYKKTKAMEIFDDMRQQHAAFDSKLVNYIVGAGHEYCREILDFLSVQDLSPNKRPVMLLIDIVDSLQSQVPAAKEGWVLAYDITKQQIIIKPFFSSKDRHPLTSPWIAPVVHDLVSLSISPILFVYEYTGLGQKTISDEVLNEINQPLDKDLQPDQQRMAFRMLVHTIAIRWVFRHWEGLISHWCQTPEESATKFACAKDAYSRIKKYLALSRFPVVTKTEPAEKEKKTVVCPFEELEWQLVEMEDYFRAGAVGAKERGEEKIAENVVSLYERLLGMVKKFNEDPRADIGMVGEATLGLEKLEIGAMKTQG